MACDSPIWVQPKQQWKDKVPVPCGRCPPCKIRRVNGWVFRLNQELNRSINAHFVTVTYNTDNVPITQNGFMTLVKKDMQDYLKRLRKLQDDKIKYYLVGEYGTIRKRPHYHAIMFNVINTDIYQKAWNKGDIHIGQVTSASMAYCMKYLDKPMSFKHARDDRQKEFSLMSKKLGENFLTDAMKKYYVSDITRLYCTNVGDYKVAMPRYYRDKIYTDEQKEAQRDHIQELFNDKTEKEKAEFGKTNSAKVMDFETYKALQKLARHNNFYKNQTLRDV